LYLCRHAFNPDFPRNPDKPLDPKEPTPKPPAPTPTTVPVIPTVKPSPDPQCVMGPADIINVATNKPAIIDKTAQKEDLKDSSEYAVSLWFRYLARYPVVLEGGKTAPWYNLIRLTS
jgi:hypothetical protein